MKAQSNAPSPGQWARYSITGDFSEGVTASNFTILSVNNNVLNVKWVDTYSDGSTIPETLSLNTTTGLGNVEFGLYFATSPGKNLGEPVYQDSRILENITISRQFNKTYAQAPRQVNYAADSNSTLSCPENNCYFDTLYYYWDQDTGIFTQIVHTYSTSASPTPKLGVDAVMTETNLWSPSQPPLVSNNENDFPLLLWVIVLTGILVLTVFLVTRYRGRKSGRK